MIALPWKQIPAPASDGDHLVASVTRLRLARWRDVTRLLRTALRLRRRFGLAAGGVAVGLAAQPLQRTFWTLTLWRDEAALLAYARSADHADTMRAFRGALEDTSSTRWQTGTRPTWTEARRQLQVASEQGSKS